MPSKDYAPALYSTALAIRNITRGIRNDITTDEKVENFISDAQDEIINRLRRAGDFNEVTTTPFALPILIPPLWDGDKANSGDIQLTGIQVADAAICEYWTIEFTSITEFTVKARFSGAQGSGNITTNFVATGSDITIPSAAWIGSPGIGDLLYINVSNVFPELFRCVSWRAACLTLSDVFTEGTPNLSEGVDKVCERAEEMIANMIGNRQSDGRILDPQQQQPLEPDRVVYVIDSFGNDVTQQVYEMDEYAAGA